MDHLVSMRPCGVEGVDEFLWPNFDYGGWTWPLHDWVNDKIDFMRDVKNFDTVVQAGGCCGMYPRFYKNYFKNVWTFEPNALNYHCLERNCSGEGFNTFNVALGDGDRWVSMDPPGEDNNTGMHTVNEAPGNVHLITLDSLNIPRCDLLHLDLEGYEEPALRGGINLIEKWNPVVIIERESGKEFLESIGYRMVCRTSMDSVFVRD